jgi:tRNA/rRNA methyltransferase
MPTLLESCRIVLVRARNPLNIGAAARAMANFGFRDLAVVQAYEPSWQEAQASAVGAGAVLKAARACSGILEAIADRTLVIGTSAGQRRAPRQERISLDEARTRITTAGKAAILFGSEKTGLSNEELSYCHALVRIPTSPRCPSMNLGQAVAVFCYELGRGSIPAPTPARVAPAAMEALEKLRQELQDALTSAGYISGPARPGDELKLRRLLLRMNISTRDVATLRGMVAQIRWKIRRA